MTSTAAHPDQAGASGDPAASDPAASDPAGPLERRFVAQSSRGVQLGIGLIALGCAALGAAVFGLWLAREPIAGSGWILLGGLLVAGVGIGLRSSEPAPVRVGPRGITIGDPREAQCLPWCDLQRIHVEGAELHITTARGVQRLPLATQGRAAARIVAEAAQRIGSRLELSPRAHERLPALKDSDGEIVAAGRLQLAGRKCLASGTSITFESDARLCDQCAALYHRQHVPAECKSCGRPLAGQAAAAPVAATG
jgi:hypothetical protein